MPHLKVMGAWSFEHWSVYESDRFVGDAGFMAVVPRNYKNAYVFRVGAEWEHVPFLPGLTLRVGGLRSISPQPGDTVSPSLTDGDSWAPSVGAGYEVLDGVRIDVGYQHAFFDKVTATPGSDAFQGSYKTQIDLVSLGVNWRTDLKFLAGH
jgi:long-subunit fatty acid transport protein